MTGRMETVVALDRMVDRQLVEQLLTTSPRLDVVDYLELEPGSTAQTGDVVVVACGEYTPDVASYVEQTARAQSDRPVVLLAPASTNGHVADAFAHGADDLVVLPAGEDQLAVVTAASEIAFALEKALARRRGTPAGLGRNLGEMVCVLGLKGGSGKTLTTANLAVSLADAGKRVAVIDLDLQFGDLGLALGLTPERTLYDLVRAGGSLAAEKLAGFMAVHPSGVRALLAPTRPDHAGVVSTEFLGRVLEVLREMSDYVIVDTPAGFTPEVITAVDNATSVCVVASLDSLSLKNTKLGFETLELMDYDPRKVRFVLNRADTKVGVSHEDVVAITGRRPSILVPSDRNVTRSVNMGEPIAMSARRSDAARAYHALAKLYLDERNGDRAAARSRRRLFRRG
jgi:pilus assembly protein CpaE